MFSKITLFQPLCHGQRHFLVQSLLQVSSNLVAFLSKNSHEFHFWSVREAETHRVCRINTTLNTQHKLCNSQGCVLFAWDQGQTQQRIPKKPQSPQCRGYNSEVRIKRLKCFVFSWNQSRESSASLTLLCVKNSQSLILLDCCDSILLPFCLCSPLHTTQWVPVKGPVCSGTDLRAMKQSHRCSSVTLVSVGCVRSQWARAARAFFLPAQPRRSPGFPTSAVTIFTFIHHSIWKSIRSTRRHGENLTSYFGGVWRFCFKSEDSLQTPLNCMSLFSICKTGKKNSHRSYPHWSPVGNTKMQSTSKRLNLSLVPHSQLSGRRQQEIGKNESPSLTINKVARIIIAVVKQVRKVSYITLYPLPFLQSPGEVKHWVATEQSHWGSLRWWGQVQRTNPSTFYHVGLEPLLCAQHWEVSLFWLPRFVTHTQTPDIHGVRLSNVLAAICLAERVIRVSQR